MKKEGPLFLKESAMIGIITNYKAHKYFRAVPTVSTEKEKEPKKKKAAPKPGSKNPGRKKKML